MSLQTCDISRLSTETTLKGIMKGLVKFLVLTFGRSAWLYRLLCRPTPLEFASFLRCSNQYYFLGNHCQIDSRISNNSPATTWIGNNSCLEACTLHASDGLFGGFSEALEEDFIVIGHHVYIGEGAVIYPGVTIGSHVQVMPGATVATDIPDHGVVYNEAAVIDLESLGTKPLHPIVAEPVAL